MVDGLTSLLRSVRVRTGGETTWLSVRHLGPFQIVVWCRRVQPQRTFFNVIVLQNVIRESPYSCNDVERQTLHDIEKLLADPRCARLESVERTFTATHKDLPGFMNADFGAGPGPSQNEERLCQLLCSADSHEARQLIIRRGSALNAPLDAKRIAVCKSARVQSCVARKPPLST